MGYDPTGHDAIYVVSYYHKHGGLWIVGHAALYYQDQNGNWWLTEYAGDKKQNATVRKYYIGSYNDIILEIEQEGYSFVYLVGDYSSIDNFVSLHVGTNYGGYNLFTNNCLTYVNEALVFTNNHEERIAIIPSLYNPKKTKRLN